MIDPNLFGINPSLDAQLIKEAKERKKQRANERFMKEQALAPEAEALKFDLKQRAQSKNLSELKKAQRLARFADSRAGRIIAASGEIGFEIGSAVGVGMRQQVDFSNEQHMLRQMFGHGEKIWGVNNEPVRINHDLNSGRSDPFDETAGMFGFGHNGERSGLF